MRHMSVWTLLGVTWCAGGVVLASGLIAIYALAPSPAPPLPELFAGAAATPACDPLDWQRVLSPKAPVHVPPAPPPGTAPPKKTKNVAPVYPEDALAARTQGVVILEVLLDCSGRVLDARVLRPVPGLDQAAVDAVRQWEYAPALEKGKPVPVIMTVTVNFTLQH